MASDSLIAVLLCAGYGTRMGLLTRRTAKPLLPVAGRPILDSLMQQVTELPGISTIHVVTNHLYFEAFEGWAETWRDRLTASGRSLEIHDDGSTDNGNRLGGAGDLQFLLERIDLPGGALVAGTDNIFRFSLEPFWREFRTARQSLLLALEETDPDALRRTGVLEFGSSGRVVRIHEKPESPPSPWACPSLYCLRGSDLARVAAYLADGGSADDLGLLINALLEHEPFGAFRVKGERLHVGSPEMLRVADETLRREPIVLDPS